MLRQNDPRWCQWHSTSRETIPRLGTKLSVVWTSLLLNALACAVATSSTSPTGSDTSQSTTGTMGNPTGVGCTADATTGVALCSGTTACPGVLVDTQQFPDCGFRTFQPSFDLECVCYGNYLCPVGTASSCQQVSPLFTNKTIADICNEVSLGYCTQPTGTQANGTGGASSTCDQACYSSCVGAPACIVACGC